MSYLITRGKIEIIENKNKLNKTIKLFVGGNVYLLKHSLIKDIEVNDVVVISYYVKQEGTIYNRIINDIAITERAPRVVSMEPEYVPASAVLSTLSRIKRDMEFVIKHLEVLKNGK